MQEFQNLEQILDYAIAREDDAAKLYAELSASVSRPGMREAFLEFAAEEGRHKARLIEIKRGDLPAVSEDKVAGLGIAETLAEVTPSQHMTYAEALAFAIRSEKAARQLYTDLAELVPSNLAAVFRSLATEEAKHQLKFETEYDEHVLEGV